VLPFKCQYCQGLFCAEHRLPENHACAHIGIAKAPKEEVQPYEYKVTYTPGQPSAKFWFSLTEIKHLTASALLVMGVGLSSFGFSLLSTPPEILIAASLIFIGAFLLHEIAHKVVAQRFGLWAEFRLILFGAFLTLLSIIIPFPKFIAPGAVMIAGTANKDIVGKTSIAGPLTNIILATISLPIAFFVSPLAFWSVSFNAWIALFNTIPFAMLDGLKIFKWNKIVWALVFAIAVALTAATFTYL